MIKTIIFDADDTLWHNENFYRESEAKYYELFSSNVSSQELKDMLYKTEVDNLPIYGFGVKAFMLSLVETLTKVGSKDDDVLDILRQIINIGREQLEKPVELLPGVKDTLDYLVDKYDLVLATKGDLMDQDRKLKKSGLLHYFKHVEIMVDKKIDDYKALFEKLNLSPDNVLMVGNSLKSDVAPIIEMGGWGVYIPYTTTWEYEKLNFKIKSKRFKQVSDIVEIPELLKQLV